MVKLVKRLTKSAKVKGLAQDQKTQANKRIDRINELDKEIR